MGKVLREGECKMRKVLIISSSPRKDGNSDMLCHEFAAAAREAGAAVEEVALRDLAISPCRACCGCWSTQRCVLRDDMAPLLEKITAADVLCVATPVYFGLPCGQLKVMVDRLLPRWQGLGGKDVYLVVTGHDGRAGLAHAADDLRLVFENLGDTVRGVVWGEHVWQKGEVAGTAAVSLAWLMAKGAVPVVGMTKPHHVDGAVEACGFALTDEECAYLEEPYVPHALVGVMAENR